MHTVLRWYKIGIFINIIQNFRITTIELIFKKNPQNYSITYFNIISI